MKAGHSPPAPDIVSMLGTLQSDNYPRSPGVSSFVLCITGSAPAPEGVTKCAKQQISRFFPSDLHLFVDYFCNVL